MRYEQTINKRLITILRYRWLTILLILPFLQPKFFSTMDIIDDLYKGMQIVSFLFIFILYLLYGRISKYVFLCLCYFVLNIIITLYFNPTYTLTYFFDVVMIIVPLVIIIELGMKVNPKHLLQSFVIILVTYTIINFILLIMNPDGIWLDYTRSNIRSGHFLGIGNQLALTLIPTATLVIFYSYFKKSRIDILSIFVIVIIYITFINVWSATAVTTMTIFILMLIFNKVYKLVSIKALSIIYSIFWITIIWFQSFSFLQPIIEEVLGKNMTLSNRTLIWNNSIEMVKESFWIGYGAISYGYYVPIGSVFATSHNVILQILLEGGIISLILMVLIYLNATKKLIKFKKNPLAIFLIIGIFCVLITFLTEAYARTYLFILLSIAVNIELIVKQKLNYAK